MQMLSCPAAIFLALMLWPVANVTANPGPVGVLAETVDEQPFYERIEAIGTLRANESVDVTANVTETITAIRFTDNQRVEERDVLAEMTSAEEQAQLEEALSTLKEAKKQYARIKQLSAQGNSPKSLLDQRKREMETAKARLTAIQSRLKDRLIIAPFAGVVGLRNISVGALVEPGDVITTLDDDSQMKLDFAVPAVYLADIKVGLPIEAKARAYGKQRFEGKVTSINSRIDPVTRSFTVRAILPNPDYKLKPGLLMSVNIEANERTAIVIPEEALVPEGQKQFVFTVGQQEDALKAVRTEITIGSRRPGLVEVTSGLEVGEQVVTDGTIKLRDGAAITLRETAF